MWAGATQDFESEGYFRHDEGQMWPKSLFGRCKNCDEICYVLYISTITDGVYFLVTLSLSELCIQVMCPVNIVIMAYRLYDHIPIIYCPWNFENIG